MRTFCLALLLCLLLCACAEPEHTPDLRYATQLSTTKPVAPFKLVDQHNNLFTNANLRGHWSIVFSGFTFCPDICPLTLGQLQAAERQMSVPRQHQVIFVTVDPQRDTAASLKQYLQLFQPHWIGLTGESSELSRFLESLGMAQVKIPGATNEQYSIEHSTAIVLLNPLGQVAAFWKAPLDTSQLAADFSSLPAAE